MAVESLPLPFSASIPSIPTRAQAERYRGVIAIAAASIFVAGVGSVYLDAQASSTTAAPAVHPAGPVTAPVPAQATLVVAPGHDSGPLRRYGAGTATDASESVLGQRIAAAEASTSSNRQSVAPAQSSVTTSSSGRGYSSSNSSSASGSSTGATTTSASRYVVRNGDNYGAIGARFGMSADRIAALNPGVDPTQLSIGKSLRIG